MILESLKQNKIYSSNELYEFIIGLEEKYNIIDQREHYNKLVNFSKNKDVPVHEWFKYREGFAGYLIDELIDDSDIEQDEMVLDCFVGSGTTLVSSVIKGYDCIGIDVNPMAVMLSKVKSSKYSETELNNAISYLDKIRRDIEIDIEDTSKYFNIENYLALKRIYKAIQEVSGKEYEILMCSYLSIIETCSNRKRDGNGLKTVQSKITDVYSFYNEKVKQVVADIRKVSNYYKGNSYVFTGDSKSLISICDTVKKENGKEIGAIIFSPPYCNSFDYFENYKIELNMGGFLTDTPIKNYRRKAIRSFIGMNKEKENDKYISLLAKEIEIAIPDKEKRTGRIDSRTRKVPAMIEGYFKDMTQVITECYNVLKANGKCYIVIDQSSYLGKIIPSDLLFCYFAEKIGFKVDRIIDCRSAKTSAQQLQLYSYLKDMLRESIIVLKK